MPREGVMNEGELASASRPAGRAARGRSHHARPRHPPRRADAARAITPRSISNGLSLDAIRAAKAAGLPITCGTSINHLTLNENDIGDYRTFLKLSPPLRQEEERRALVEALAEGLIDVIVSDHNPQDVETKRLPFAEAEPGAIGLETMLSAGLRLVHAGEIACRACSPR